MGICCPAFLSKCNIVNKSLNKACLVQPRVFEPASRGSNRGSRRGAGSRAGSGVGMGPGRGAGQGIGSGARGAGSMQPRWEVRQMQLEAQQAQQAHQAAAAQVSLTLSG